MNRYLIPSITGTLMLALAQPWAVAHSSQSGTNSQSGGSGQAGVNSQTGNSGQSTTISQESTNPRGEIGAPPKSEIGSFQKAKLSLTDAVKAAKQQQQGKAVEARFEMWDGQPSYFVRTCANNRIWEGRINADSGQLIGPPKTFTPKRSNQQLKQEAQTVQKAHESLIQAINSAEQQQGGKAIMAKVRTGSSGQPSYDVDVVKDGKLHTAMVNANSGKIG